MQLSESTTVTTASPPPGDSPEVRRYNRVRRWLGMADAVIGFLLLIVLLVTGWTGTLRDWSYHSARQHYFLAVFLYVLMFSVIIKALSAPFDYLGFRLEHQYKLSNQKMRLVAVGRTAKAGSSALFSAPCWWRSSTASFASRRSAGG